MSATRRPYIEFIWVDPRPVLNCSLWAVCFSCRSLAYCCCCGERVIEAHWVFLV